MTHVARQLPHACYACSQLAGYQHEFCSGQIAVRHQRLDVCFDGAPILTACMHFQKVERTRPEARVLVRAWHDVQSLTWLAR